MPVILVIIVVAAWIVILGPSLMRRRSQAGGGITSMSHFHRTLRTLEHAGPEPIVTPAYRLRAAGDAGAARAGGGFSEIQAVPVLTVVGADRLPRPALAFLGEPPAGQDVSQIRPAPSRRSSTERARTDDFGPDDFDDDDFQRGDSAMERLNRLGRPSEAYARSQVRRRRRDTLGVLAIAFVGTLLIGFVPGASAAWIVSMIAGAALAGYVALLVHLRRNAEDTVEKLRYLQPGSVTAGYPAGAARVPMYMSGRYAHPSNQAAAAH
jgi:hypothetical protein